MISKSTVKKYLKTRVTKNDSNDQSKRNILTYSVLLFSHQMFTKLRKLTCFLFFLLQINKLFLN